MHGASAVLAILLLLAFTASVLATWHTVEDFERQAPARRRDRTRVRDVAGRRAPGDDAERLPRGPGFGPGRVRGRPVRAARRAAGAARPGRADARRDAGRQRRADGLGGADAGRRRPRGRAERRLRGRPRRRRGGRRLRSDGRARGRGRGGARDRDPGGLAVRHRRSRDRLRRGRALPPRAARPALGEPDGDRAPSWARTASGTAANIESRTAETSRNISAGGDGKRRRRRLGRLASRRRRSSPESCPPHRWG